MTISVPAAPLLPAGPDSSDTAGDASWCAAELPKVSRTFALTIKLLPAQLRHEVGVAYLLCRIADTIEDTADLPVPTKVDLLARFKASLNEAAPADPVVAAAFAVPRIDDEALVRDHAAALGCFHRLEAAARADIRPWVAEMCDGMAGFAQQYVRDPQRLTALQTVDDLDRYCWFVAGTVGHLLTALFARQLRLSPAQRQRLSASATGFGLGLQLTNIIKDVADDRARGWSFVPRALCAAHGTTPEAMNDPAQATANAAVMAALVTKARGHLDEALTYSLTLPRHAYRIRLFCLTPLFFAVRTLDLAARDPRLLDPTHKVKITRTDVKRTVAVTHLVAPSNALCRWYCATLMPLAHQPAKP